MDRQLAEKLDEARTFKKAFKLPETIQALKECLEIDPHCVIASAQAGLCSLIAGQPLEAEEFLEQAFKDTKQADLPVAAYYAAALSANDKEDRAADIRKLCPAIEETYLTVAEMLSEKGKHTEALRLIEVLSSAYLNTDLFKIPVSHYRLIRLLARAGVLDVASILADSLLAETSDSWEGLAAKASVSMAEKQYDEAYNFTVRALQRGGASNPLLAAQQHWLAMNKSGQA